MDIERRAAPRRPAHVYFNKYIDGHPHLCEAIELSTTGMLVRKIHEPDSPRACYAVELAGEDVRDELVWLCATSVWTDGPFEALGFVAQSPRDLEKIEAMMARLAA